MPLFKNKKETQKQQSTEIKKTKGRRAKTAQQSIPYEEMYPNGMIKVGPGLYSKSYYFGDMNFATEKEDKQEEILKSYSKLLSKYAPNVTAQFTVFNRKASADKIKDKFFLKPRNGSSFGKAEEEIEREKRQQEYRDEYNAILDNRIKEGRNDIQKERYITLTLKTTDVIMANRTFATLDEETNNAVREINKTGVRPLTIEERICILHDIYKVGEEDFFPDLLNDYKDENGEFSLEKLFKKGLTTKDLIAPSSYMNGMAQIQLGEYNYAKTFLISNFPTAMDTSFLSEITNIPCAMLTSVIFKSCPHKKAIRDVKAQNSAIKSEVVKANQKAIKNNYDPSLISEDLLTAREEAAELVREVTVHNQKLFFTTVTVTLLATSLDELKEYSEILKMRISDFSCQVNTLYGQQTVGFKTSLPLGMNYTEIDRMLTADSIDALFPFSVQELMDQNGHFYGLNPITKNMIVYNRRDSYLPNGLIVGQSGRGKSFFAKGEIIPNLLDTDDDFIIMDPDGEYVAMANEFGGTVINVSQRSETHINPLDMDINYAASKNDDPVAMKADYLVSLCESATKQVGGLTPYEINTIQKVTKIIYKDYLTNLEEMKKNNPNITIDTDSSPTLASFYSALLDMDGPEAHQLAMAMERFCVGNDDVFAHRTNINPKSRLIVYNLKPMPKNMKEFGMMVCLSDIWNRIVRNKDEHKNKATWVYLDEFYLMVQTESSAIMLQEYFKRCRKYHGIMTGITQDIEDLLITPEGRGIFNNSGFVAMLSQSNIGRSEIQEQFDVSDALIDYIKDKPLGTGLLYTGQTVVPFNYNLPKDTKLYKLMSTKPSEE